MATNSKTKEDWLQKVWAVTQVLGIPALIALNLFVAANQLTSAKDIGAQGERLNQIAQDQDRRFNELSARIEGQAEGISTIRRRMEFNQRDVGEVLTTLNIVKPEDVFSAVIYQDDVWIIPNSSLRKRFEFEGKVLTKVSAETEVFGYKAFSLKKMQ